jgi:chemotaxis protein MotB
MPRKSKPTGDDGPAAPAWLLTYSDFVTLLLTFFVLLVSFSSFGEEPFRRLRAAFGKGFLAVNSAPAHRRDDLDAFLPRPDILLSDELDQGSEFPTLSAEQQSDAMQETFETDFEKKKVFTIASSQVFWGNGPAIRPEGRRWLDTLAGFLKYAYGGASRLVISESGPEAAPLHSRQRSIPEAVTDARSTLSLERAWAVVEYLATKQALDRNLFSISGTSMLRGGRPPAERALEITILEQDTYR